MTTLNNEKKSLVEGLFKHYKKDELTRSEINQYVDDNGIKNPSWLKSNTYKIGRGVYRLPVNGDISPVVSEPVSTKTETAPETNTTRISSRLQGFVRRSRPRPALPHELRPVETRQCVLPERRRMPTANHRSSLGSKTPIALQFRLQYPRPQVLLPSLGQYR